MSKVHLDSTNPEGEYLIDTVEVSGFSIPTAEAVVVLMEHRMKFEHPWDPEVKTEQ